MKKWEITHQEDRVKRIRAGSAVVLALAALCSGARAGAQPAAPVAVHHIHGLAVDPREPETLLVATHTGLVRLGPQARLEWVGEQRFDLMGFTAEPGGAKGGGGGAGGREHTAASARTSATPPEPRATVSAPIAGRSSCRAA